MGSTGHRRDWGWLAPAVLVLALVPAVHAAPVLSGGLGAGHDSNALNARGATDVRADGFVALGLHAGWPLGEGLDSRWDVRASVMGEAWDRLDGLSHVRAEARLRWRFRPAGGFYAPTFSAWGTLAGFEYDSRLRDGADLRLGVSMLQPVNTAFAARVTLAAYARDSYSPVFDLASGSLELGVDWTPAPRWVVYGGYRWQSGDIVSTSSTELPYADDGEPEDAGASAARAKSTHIVDCGSGPCAYRLDANAGIASLGLNLALGHRWALDLLNLYTESRVPGGAPYYRASAVLSLLGRF